MGHMPHVWEKKYTPLNTEHMGKGRDAMGEAEAGARPKRWLSRAPSQLRRGHCFQESLKKKKIIQPKGRW